MELGIFKTLLASLLLPPLGPMLLAMLGLLLAARRQAGGLSLSFLSLLLLGWLSCPGTAVWLARTALPQFSVVSVDDLKARRVQAIVVLGGGVLPAAPEYGEPQASSFTAARLRYGARLARQTGLPMAFSGGIGWAASETQVASEAQVAARLLQQDYGMTLRWSENQSRDTAANARLTAPLLKKDGVQRIALVTDAWHLPRAVLAFERAGLTVTPAPMAFVLPVERALLQWLPSPRGLLASQQVLRECLALAIGNFTPQ